MQWILQEFEDTRKLAEALDALVIPYTWHKVVPFIGELQPEPEIEDPNNVVMFGSYTLWKYAEANNLKPGVFRIRPFVHETSWQPHMLNGADALFAQLNELNTKIETATDYFFRPVEDSKEVPGTVKSGAEILEIVSKITDLNEDEIPKGSLRADTEMMLTKPAKILKEWRLWIVQDKIVAYSMYKEGNRVEYRREIDADALAFGNFLVSENAGYSPAYVMDICRTPNGLHMLETNCINAAGFYAADLSKLIEAIESL